MRRDMRRLQKIICVLLVAVMLGGMFSALAVEPVGRWSSDWAVHTNPHYPDAQAPGRVPGEAVPMASAARSAVTCTTVEQAGEILREAMKARQASVSLVYAYCENRAAYDRLFNEIVAAALLHTGDGREGDYLRWQYDGIRMSSRYYTDSDGSLRDISITLSMTYYTTAGQEAQLDAAVEMLLDELALDDKTDYEKVCGIYDYICANVEYDYAHLNSGGDYPLMYTAYAALINKTSVCQGYANLFYRLALELGLDARTISGYGNSGAHAWNIVELDGSYYLLDATWDAPRVAYGYEYFLRGSKTFYTDHIPNSEYASEEFLAAYPISADDFTPPVRNIASGTCGENLIWALTEEGVLTISGQGAMEDYTEGGAPWYSNFQQITSVEIQDGVTTIGAHAFHNCTALTNMIIPDGVTAIAAGAFSGCTALGRITVGENNTAYCDVDGVLFSGDKKTLITYPAGKTERAYEIPGSVSAVAGYAFYGCAALTGITIPTGVTAIGASAFDRCTALETVHYSGSRKQWNNIAIGSLNEELTHAQIVCAVPDVLDEGTCGEELVWTLMENGLLTISGQGAMEDYEMGGAPWYDHRALITVAVVESGVTGMGAAAFADCAALAKITLPVSVGSVAAGAFSGCSALESVYYAGTQQQWDAITIGGENDPLRKAELVLGLLGDANGDGKVNGTDTNLIFRFVSGTLDFTADQIAASDVNRDGKVNGTDTNLVFRFVSGTLASLG